MAVPMAGGWALRRRSPDNTTWIYNLGAPNMPEVWEEDDAFMLIFVTMSTYAVFPSTNLLTGRLHRPCRVHFARRLRHCAADNPDALKQRAFRQVVAHPQDPF
jgi:hypothetical protein